MKCNRPLKICHDHLVQKYLHPQKIIQNAGSEIALPFLVSPTYGGQAFWRKPALSAMISGLFGLQKVQEIYNISAIGWPFPKVRTVARYRNLMIDRCHPQCIVVSLTTLSPKSDLEYILLENYMRKIFQKWTILNGPKSLSPLQTHLSPSEAKIL